MMECSEIRVTLDEAATGSAESRLLDLSPIPPSNLNFTLLRSFYILRLCLSEFVGGHWARNCHKYCPANRHRTFWILTETYCKKSWSPEQ